MTNRLPWLACAAAVALLASTAAPAADPPAVARQAAAGSAPPGARVRPVDINSARRAELMTLPGIGRAEADRIIAGRPYLSKAMLVSGKVLSEQAYQALTGRIVAVQNDMPPRPARTGAPSGKP